MYPALLANRYLATRIIPLIAVAAVGLCVGLVIIVVSVMSGFLDMVVSSGRTLMGDVVVQYPINGLPYYERLIDRIEALDEVHAASPVVDGWGLLRMPYPPGDKKSVEQVQFWAIEPHSFAAVTGYGDTLYWRPLTEAELADDQIDLYRHQLMADDRVGRAGLQRWERLGLDLEWRPPLRDDPEGAMAGIVLGMHVSIGNQRQHDGTYWPSGGGFPPRWWMPGRDLLLTSMPLNSASPRPVSRPLRVVNEFVSGVFLIDDTRVMIPLSVGQELLGLTASEWTDEDGELTGRSDPARATMVLVRAADDVTPDELKQVVATAYDAYVDDVRADVSIDPRSAPPYRGFGGAVVETWREMQRRFIDPVEKERDLMRTLFSIVYIVCAGLVLAIFWAIVYEKTRDIGILRSIGASRAGIALIFIRYGAIIGGIGSIVGVALGFAVIRNINAIHGAMGQPAPTWMWLSAFITAGVCIVAALWCVPRGRLLPVVLWILATIVLIAVGVGLRLHKGTLLWDPSVYYFSEIPSHVDTRTALYTMGFGVLFSMLGAFIPAIRAADTDPVQALRYE